MASLKHLSYGDTVSPQFPILVMMDIIYNNFISHERKVGTELYGDTFCGFEQEKSQRPLRVAAERI